MAKINYTLSDMPDDVIWVLMLQNSRQPVGTETYNNVINIVKQYPDWFEWEHKYAAIPQNVHDNYWEEVNTKIKLNTEHKGKGIVDAIQDGFVSSEELAENSKKSLQQMLEEIMLSESVRKEQKKEQDGQGVCEAGAGRRSAHQGGHPPQQAAGADRVCRQRQDERDRQLPRAPPGQPALPHVPPGR
jgi:hypothetical protein